MKSRLGGGFILRRRHPKWRSSSFCVWRLGRWGLAFKDRFGGPPCSGQKGREVSFQSAPCWEAAARLLPAVLVLVTLLPAVEVACGEETESVSTLSFPLAPSTSGQTSSETARPWPGKGLAMKSLARNSGCPQAPLLASGGGLRCRPWCPSLDPWPSLSRGRGAGSSGPAALHPELAPVWQRWERRGEGLACPWLGGTHASCWPGSLCMALKGLMTPGLTGPGPLLPFRPFPLRPPSPSSGLHILCLGSSAHTSLI